MSAFTTKHLRSGGALVLAVVAVLVAGCGSSSSDSDSSSSKLVDTTPPATGQIDSFTWALPYGEPTSLDPAFAYNYSENTVLSNICEGLLRENPQGEIEPALAERVDHPTPDDWVYTIRPGVKFFDGSPLTADDVVYSISRHLDPTVGSFYGTPYGAEIASVKKTGDMEVTVTTRKPNTLINDMMVTGLGTIASAKSIQEQGKDFGTPDGDLDCTGPFELADWKPGSSITLTRNPGYWDSDLAAKSAQIVFQFFTDQTALANALTSGEVDGTYEAPVAALDELQGSGNGTLYQGPSTQGLTLIPTRGAMSEKLRQALSNAIDRDAIAETAFAGTASAQKTWASPDASNYGEDIYRQAYDAFPDPDPERAPQLAQEAGGTPTPLKLAVASGDPAQSQTAASIQDAAKDAGIDIQIESLPPAQFQSLFFDEKARSAYDLLMASTYGDVYDILQLYFIAFKPDSLQNIAGFSDPVATQKIDEAVGIDDETKRAEVAVAAGEPISESQANITVLRTNELLYMNPTITGAPARFPYQYYPWAASVGAKD
jgi:peptide/nickel transport system substrate-binding protein